ncbi:MAG: 50S ribosomal protein L10 [Planctomycetota bacterium]|nr:50S ribosomal protein L10 [Planctomycetota bacterium]RLS38799.1 MAG: 50S ribosomal protein L10 [Planctomycetota bacterium]
MSKVVKALEIETLRKEFSSVRDLVVLDVERLDCLGNGSLRTSMRKKKINLRMLKNSFARKVFGDLGIAAGSDSAYFSGMTMVAYGASSISELCRELEGELLGAKTKALYKDKVKVRGAIADGQSVAFAVALKMPTRLEAISNVAGMVLAPAARLAQLITSPGATVAGQIKQVGEKAEAPAA